MRFRDSRRLRSCGRPTRAPVERLPIVLLACISSIMTGGLDGISGRARAEAPVSQEQRRSAVNVLQVELAQGDRSTRVRAAESLLALDVSAGVADVLQKDLEAGDAEDRYRIEIWRLLARASPDDRQRESLIQHITEAFLAGDASKRSVAAANLARLRYEPRGAVAVSMQQAALHGQGSLLASARWVLANSGKAGDEKLLVDLLSSGDPTMRGEAAHAIRHLRRISPEGQPQLVAAAKQESSDSPARVFLAAAAAIHAPPEQRQAWTSILRSYLESGSPAERSEACAALATVGNSQDLPRLADMLKASEADLRIGAATAILRIDRRVARHLEWLDWVVIGTYCLGMLAVGAFYSRRTKSTEDYLLGGRRMNPLAVGVSLFATLLSAISYLSWPGEMIRYGPLMVIGCVASYPLIALVVGWFMIPFIMRLRVTTAYELLDQSIGGHVRLLGSSVFLAMRLIWMAVIIYVSAAKLLAPLMGLGPAAVPYISVVLGVIVVIYTSMGGIRAVVVTDVLQTVVMFGGGILTVAAVTSFFGGVGGWWPSEWPSHWPEMAWGFDPRSRTTFIGTFVAIFTWYICVSCSDQMAVQRYLSTRDVKAARTVLVTCLGVDAVVTLFLAFLGLPLLAYFRANPHLIPDGQTMLESADVLFPRFMAYGLPAGLSGLLVAGVLAAAMSSLSSGLNSSCSVIVGDLLDRKVGPDSGRTGEVQKARFLSAVVGGIVVLMSAFVGMVQGNLMEVAFKLVNLFAAPLAGLFIMAMFVKRANPFGAYVGFVLGLTMVALISYWEELTGGKGISFVWAMPLGLLVQVASGTLASFLRADKKARREAPEADLIPGAG